jgi:putative oxidoreductase
MKSHQEVSLRQILMTLLRVLLGVVLTYASIEKLADPDAFAVSISNYRIVTAVPALLLATVLPWIELLCGLAFLFGLWVQGTALLTFSMLVVFTGAVVSALLRGLDISCGCFTQGLSAEKIGWKKIGENAILILMTFPLMMQSTPGFMLERLLRVYRECMRREV